MHHENKSYKFPRVIDRLANRTTTNRRMDGLDDCIVLFLMREKERERDRERKWKFITQCSVYLPGPHSAEMDLCLHVLKQGHTLGVYGVL